MAICYSGTLARRAWRHIHTPWGRWFRRIFPAPVQDEFDQRLGVRTSHVRRVRSGNRYQTIPETAIMRILGMLPSDSQFIDLGCGLGKVLMLATGRFRSITGVEYSPLLARRCRSNLAYAKLQAVVAQQNAAEFQFPAGPLSVYLYNPFGEEVMRAVVENLKRHRGPLTVAYVSPAHRSLFDDWMEPVSAKVEGIALAVWTRA